MSARLAIWFLRDHRIRGMLLAATGLMVLVPLVAIAGVAGLLSHEATAGCIAAGAGSVEQPAGGGPVAAGMYAAPLNLVAGRSYEVGATEYGGPGDPSSGSYGSIPDPAQAYLPDHPDTFAELSLLDTDPASQGTFTFTDADALGELPYMTGLWVRNGGQRMLLYKRDIGYGQGPGQVIANGEPYRLDVWWQAAQTLQVTKTAVQIQLAPVTGAGATLEALPTSSEADPGTFASETCTGETAGEATGAVPLLLAPGTQTRILPSGLAAAGEDAPAAVKEMVAAGNRLYGTAYLYGGAHGTPLSVTEPAYDCSSAVSYLLHAAGLLGEYAWDSGQLEHYGQPGPGRYVSIYANAGHVFMYVAGLRFDTVEDPEWDSGPNSGKPGARWRVSGQVPDWASWVVRHPPGL